MEYPIKPVAISSFEGSFFIHGTLQDNKQTSQGTVTREKQTYFEEGIECSTRGYFYHPNMADWQLSFSPGRTQETLDINNESMKTQGKLLNYNFSTLFLKEKPVSGQVFASHNETLRDRDFAQSVLFDEDRRGATVYTKGGFPTSFLAETTSTHETSDLRDVTTDTKHYRATVADRRKENWLTELTFDRRDKAETAIYSPTTGGPTTTQNLPDKADEANLNHNWRFGSGPDKHSLVGHYRALDETGAFMNRVFSGEENLQLVHSDTLTSFYTASYENNKTSEETDVTKMAEAGFTKKIYDSLDLTFRLNDRDETTDTTSDKSLRGSMEAVYQKKTPIGIYNSSLDLSAEREHQQSSTGQLLIQRQPLVLPEDFSWIRLTRPNVTGPILVISSVTQLPYAENVQYELRTIGAFTEIRKMPFSVDPIPAGETILLTYTVQSAKDAVIGRKGVVWNNRLTLDKVPLSFYANFQDLDERLVSGDDPGSINPQDGALYGVEWNYKDFQVAVEHENRIQAWMNWRYHITGLLYWCTVFWEQAGDVWTNPLTFRPHGHSRGGFRHEREAE
ncbi:MAG: hypothetical protein NTV86_06995 [Planctomycetota bacterium]|nr:hypothetical protein [Planctomycetota bacterium]